MASMHLRTITEEQYERVVDEIFLVTAIAGAAIGAWVGTTLASGTGEAIRLLAAAAGAVGGSVLGTTTGRLTLLPLVMRWGHQQQHTSG
ncbi:MAG: hypothetical protein NZ703_10825 [Gemmataceae bacterium]|nr:hypothetical protein [Gemmataceae bacterium]MDW8244116.1 hypothetical protein [Thermogemmata sp.]